MEMLLLQPKVLNPKPLYMWPVSQELSSLVCASVLVTIPVSVDTRKSNSHNLEFWAPPYIYPCLFESSRTDCKVIASKWSRDFKPMACPWIGQFGPKCELLSIVGLQVVVSISVKVCWHTIRLLQDLTHKHHNFLLSVFLFILIVLPLSFYGTRYSFIFVRRKDISTQKKLW